MTPTRYLRGLLSAIASGALLVALFNAAVDPYRVVGTRDVQGFNALKPDFVESLRLTTPYALDRHAPEGLILGTSRAGRGYSPHHPGWGSLNTYNAALPAVSLYEVWRTLQHAQATKPLKRIVLGLDNRVFYADRDGNGAFSERRLKVDRAGRPQHLLFAATLPDLAASLLSVDATLASLRAVRFQGWTRLTLGPDGQWESVGSTFDAYQGFRAMTTNTFDRYRRYAAEPFRLDSAVGPLREIIRLCHREGIDLRMVIPPSHAWHWEAVRLSEMGERFDDIRRAIVAVNDEVAREAGSTPFPVWDFSGYRGHNTENAPARAGERPLWFWETVHFNTRLGDLVLDEVFERPAAGSQALGSRIDNGDIEAHLTDWHAARTVWAAAHAADVTEIETLYRQWQARLNAP